MSSRWCACLLAHYEVIGGEADECSNTDMAAMVVGNCRLPRNWRPDLNSATTFSQKGCGVFFHRPGDSNGHFGINQRNCNLAQIIGTKREKPIAENDDGLSVQSNRGDRTPLELFLAGVRGWEAGLWRFLVQETDGGDRNGKAKLPRPAARAQCRASPKCGPRSA